MHPSNSERSKLLSLKYLREMLLLFTMIQKGTISAIFWDIVDGKTGFSLGVLRGRYHTDQNSQAWSKVLLVHNAIEHHCKEYFQSMMTLCQSTYRSYFSRLLSKRDMQDFILKKICHIYTCRRIFVYTFCLINICLSLSDDDDSLQ